MIPTVIPYVNHKLKCHPAPFQAIWDGDKLFEFRKNDRDYRVGDTLSLREYDPEIEKYLGRYIFARATYALYSGFGLPEGYCIMQLRVLSKTDDKEDWGE